MPEAESGSSRSIPDGRVFESGDIPTSDGLLDQAETLITGKRAWGTPKYNDEYVQKYQQNYNQWVKYPYKHHIGQYEEFDAFDVQFNAAENGLLVTADELRDLENTGKVARQKLTDICYMAGIPEDLIPEMVGTKTSPAQLMSHLAKEGLRKKKEIAEMNKELKKMMDDLHTGGHDTIFKVDLEAPEHVECTKKVVEYNLIREDVVASLNVIKPKYDEEIAAIKAELGRLHAIEGIHATDNEELRLRENRMSKVVPNVNCFASWLAKDNAILLNMQERSTDKTIKPVSSFARRYEPEGTDIFWESMDAPWDHSAIDDWFSPTVEEVREKITQEQEDQEEEERRNTTTVVHTGLVEEADVEVEIVLADKPFMICFGDPRALRPVYMPSAGTESAAIANAFHHIGAPLENIADGNDLFFGDLNAIGASDHTKMELIREIMLDQLLVLDSEFDEGGDLQDNLERMKRPVPGGDQTLIMNTFERHEVLERECIERYKLPTQNTFMYERHAEPGGRGDEGKKFPRYIENFELWFGDKLPKMTSERQRFGFYDVRRRSKKADKQKLLWMGIVFTRKDDVAKVKEILNNEIGCVKPLFEEIDDTAAPTRFCLANIVGRAKQRKWADAFVRADVNREASLPADVIFDIITGPKAQHKLNISVPLEDMEERWDEMFPEVDMVVDQLTYAEYEEFVVDVMDNFEKDNDEHDFFREQRKLKLREEYEADLLNMFQRYDWDRSGSLETKEVFGILGELEFSDVDAEMVEALVNQYDKDTNGSVDEEEFIDLALDALLTLDEDGSLMGSIYNYFNTGPKIHMGVKRIEKKRVCLWFDEADAADNDLAEVNLDLLGEIEVINGFEVMCRAADMRIDARDRKSFYDDKFRMELVRMLFMQTYAYIDKSSTKKHFRENHEVNLQQELSSIGEPNGKLSKEAFIEAIADYKAREEKLKEFKQPPVGTRNLLEKMNRADFLLWMSASMHLKYCDMIDITSNEETIPPSPKAESRFDMYTCRPTDEAPISWMLIVMNDDNDISHLLSEYGEFTMDDHKEGKG